MFINQEDVNMARIAKKKSTRTGAKTKGVKKPIAKKRGAKKITRKTIKRAKK